MLQEHRVCQWRDLGINSFDQWVSRCGVSTGATSRLCKVVISPAYGPPAGLKRLHAN
jgi:hypothetical protein